MRAWSTTSVALALFFAALAGADLSDSENLAELRMEVDASPSSESLSSAAWPPDLYVLSVLPWSLGIC
jgi:hypothetical protein